MGRLSSIFCYGKTDGENPKSETFRGEDPLPKSAASPGRGSVAGHKVNSPRQGRRDHPLGDSARAEKPTRMSVSQAGNRRTQGAELIAWAVVKDDNLHRRPKRALVTLPAACGFRLSPAD